MEINQEDVKFKYNSLDIIWDDRDKWHSHTHKMISDFIQKRKSEFLKVNERRILNVGSAGYSYGLDESKIIHMDIADQKIKHISDSIVASVENIPLIEGSIGGILCVGSVINYCDPMVAISELARILTKNGILILEFENSNTLELIGSPNFNKKAVLIETFYMGNEKIWLFSESFIKEILQLNNLKIIAVDRCHIISPMIYKLTKNENFAAIFGKLDVLLKRLPFLNHFSSNTIFFIQKTT